MVRHKTLFSLAPLYFVGTLISVAYLVQLFKGMPKDGVESLLETSSWIRFLVTNIYFALCFFLDFVLLGLFLGKLSEGEIQAVERFFASGIIFSFTFFATIYEAIPYRERYLLLVWISNTLSLSLLVDLARKRFSHIANEQGTVTIAKNKRLFVLTLICLLLCIHHTLCFYSPISESSTRDQGPIQAPARIRLLPRRMVPGMSRAPFSKRTVGSI